MPPPLPTSLRLPKQLKDFLWRRAQDEHRNLSQMIIHVLEMYRQSFNTHKTASGKLKIQPPQEVSDDQG